MSETTQPPSTAENPTLHVCITCRRTPSTEAATQAAGEAEVPGRQLFDRLTQTAETAGFEIRSVQCMASCGRGCSAAVSMPEKWTLLLGNLAPEKADDLVSWLDLYRNSKTGIVPASKRPESLADMVIARLPAALAPA